MANKRLTRSVENRWLAGVLGGIAEYTELDPTAVRLIGIVLLFVTGALPFLILYIIAWAMMPEDRY